MILNDRQIRERCKGSTPMIYPFTGEKVREVDGKPVMSFGLSSAGYDVSLAPEWKYIGPNAFLRPDGTSEPVSSDWVDGSIVCIDPTLPPEETVITGETYLLRPGTSVLSRTIEYFDIPDDLIVICLGKSTYARSNVLVNITPIEPGFMGNITIEISNTGEFPVLIRAGAIAQFLFNEVEAVEVPYGDGKYQGQTGVVSSRMANADCAQSDIQQDAFERRIKGLVDCRGLHTLRREIMQAETAGQLTWIAYDALSKQLDLARNRNHLPQTYLPLQHIRDIAQTIRDSSEWEFIQKMLDSCEAQIDRPGDQSVGQFRRTDWRFLAHVAEQRAEQLGVQVCLF